MDAVKISIPISYWEILRANKDLKWDLTIDDQGELKKATAYHNHINFKYQKPTYSKDKSLREIRLEFSFSCVLNDGYNYLDPSIYQLQSVIKYMHDDLKINPFDAIIHFIEFGCTILSPVKYSLIENSLIAFNGKMFNAMPKQGTQTKIGNKCTMSQMEIKIYGKHSKYPELNLPDLLRVEVKAFKMDFLKLGYTLTLGNLLDTNTLNRFREILSTQMKFVVFNEMIPDSKLSKPQKRLINDWSNPKYIEVLAKNKPTKYRKEKQNYLKLIPTNSIWNQIQVKILDKWDSLLIEDQKKGTDLTIDQMNFESKNGTNLTYMIGNTNNTNLTNSIQDNAANPEPKVLEGERRFCKGSGIEISHQRKDSVFVRESTLRKMKEDYDPLMYDYLKSKHGPPEKKSFKQELIIIAKYFRNLDSNPRAIEKAKEVRKIVKHDFAVQKYKSSLFPFENRTAEG